MENKSYAFIITFFILLILSNVTFYSDPNISNFLINLTLFFTFVIIVNSCIIIYKRDLKNYSSSF